MNKLHITVEFDWYPSTTGGDDQAMAQELLLAPPIAMKGKENPFHDLVIDAIESGDTEFSAVSYRARQV